MYRVPVSQIVAEMKSVCESRCVVFTPFAIKNNYNNVLLFPRQPKFLLGNNRHIYHFVSEGAMAQLSKGAFHLTELTGQTRHLEGLTLHRLQINTLWGRYTILGRMRGVIMQVFLQIVAFSLQTDGSGRPVLTKGKRPKRTGWSQKRTDSSNQYSPACQN